MVNILDSLVTKQINLRESCGGMLFRCNLLGDFVHCLEVGTNQCDQCPAPDRVRQQQAWSQARSDNQSNGPCLVKVNLTCGNFYGGSRPGFLCALVNI